MSCISFATAANEAFIVPFTNMDGSSYWSLEEEVKIWTLLVKVLGDPGIKKILQNSLYDRFVLQYGYEVVVKGIVDDTLVKHWELYAEMRKSLAFLCSIYTKQPYYKEMRVQAEEMEEVSDE
jgi:DNA polymerase I-like protein with 3'-5' exonuclease and polymerase domains